MYTGDPRNSHEEQALLRNYNEMNAMTVVHAQECDTLFSLDTQVGSEILEQLGHLDCRKDCKINDSQIMSVGNGETIAR